MSTFTMRLQTLIDSVPAEERDEALGLASYPIFEPDYREGLNQKIVDHYLNQEIGMETPQMFRLAMRRRLNEIMPYYNKLYASEQLTFDPLKTVDMKTISTGEVETVTARTGTSTTESDNISNSRSVFSETPSTMLRGNGDYASNATDSNAESKVNATAEEGSSDNTTGETTNTTEVSGYSAMPAELLTSYRGALLNLDMSVINELQECFMLVWNNGNTYTEQTYLGGYYY